MRDRNRTAPTTLPVSFPAPRLPQRVGREWRTRLARLLAVPLLALPLPFAGRVGAAETGRGVDLAPFVGERIEDQWPSSNWASIPREVESSDGVRFQISGIVRVTGLAAARVGNWVPPQVVGIPVGGSFDTLHLLHTLEGADRDGTPVLGILLDRKSVV